MATLIASICGSVISALGLIVVAKVNTNTGNLLFRIERVEKKIDEQDTIKKELIQTKERLENAKTDIAELKKLVEELRKEVMRK